MFLSMCVGSSLAMETKGVVAPTPFFLLPGKSNVIAVATTCMSSHRGLHHLTSSAGSGFGSTTKEADNANIREDENKLLDIHIPPSTPRCLFRRWGALILRFFASVVLPFWKAKWARIQRIEGEAEVVAEEINNAAEVVKKVAAMTEKVSDEMAEALPENSRLQKAAMVIENVSKVAAADANLAENITDKVAILKQDFEELENTVGGQ